MKKVALVAAAVAVGIVFTLILIPSEKSERTQIFHARLADPRIYQDGLFSDSFHISQGTYEFRFVPNGDSPEILTITLSGPSFSFSEDFVLEGTLHETGISKYYTWNYLGQTIIEIPEEQQLSITIDPHGNTLGPVSVYLIK
ncbi:MAG: hypothetical protein QXG67_02810 [Candidatus Nitrosotenuis sp.]